MLGRPHAERVKKYRNSAAALRDDGYWITFMGGQIAVDELRHGVINNVIGIALVETEHSNIYSWPANRSDGYNPLHLPNRIPEGLRFRLDPSVDVGTLQIHPIAKIVAKAAQTYGFVVWDRAGAVRSRAENPKLHSCGPT